MDSLVLSIDDKLSKRGRVVGMLQEDSDRQKHILAIQRSTTVTSHFSYCLATNTLKKIYH